MRRLLELNLGEDGFTTLSAGEAESGLKLLRENSVDLVVTDLKLPGMNGLELQRRLAQNGNRVPIIFLSAHASDEDERSALRAGAIRFLRKPISKEALLSAIRDAVERSIL